MPPGLQGSWRRRTHHNSCGPDPCASQIAPRSRTGRIRHLGEHRRRQNPAVDLGRLGPELGLSPSRGSAQPTKQRLPLQNGCASKAPRGFNRRARKPTSSQMEVTSVPLPGRATAPPTAATTALGGIDPYAQYVPSANTTLVKTSCGCARFGRTYVDCDYVPRLQGSLFPANKPKRLGGGRFGRPINDVALVILHVEVNKAVKDRPRQISSPLRS